MIPNETLQTIQTNGEVAVVGNFKITDATQARILVSLSDKMYTRKQLAAVREYSTNAADAHVVVKRPISEIVVTLPTMQDLNLKIRDYGTGLTEEQIKDVYCIIGESTKRNSDEFNGVLGYGCKAGFASADSFTVTSWINGEKSVYQCIKGDSTRLHSAIRLSRVASSEPIGIEINIPVSQDTLWDFHREAVDFYKYWPVLPTIINLTDEEKERLDKFRSVSATLKGEGWEIRPAVHGAHAIAYMGLVPYSIDWNVLYHKMSLNSKKRVLFDLLQKNDVTLYFKMGEVQFVDSRESLEYTEKTLKALMDRIEGIFSKIKDSIQEKFNGLPTLWDAKIVYNAIFGTGVLELERGETEDADTVERIKILDGNLMQLEHTFAGSFTWNGITLDGSDFRDINRFDNNDTKTIEGKSHMPVAPVMITYRKKKQRVKVNRCKADANNTIVASPHATIVVNDTGHKSGQSMVSRYLIFGKNKSLRTVHVLTFADKTIEKAFYTTYNFETVPVIKLTDILAEAKAWNNANKVSRSYGGGGGGTRAMMFLNLETDRVEESEVPVKEIEEGAFYVDSGTSRRGRRYSGPTIKLANGWNEIRASHSLTHIKTLVEEMDLDVDKIYIINSKTSEAKWFKQALESGDWISFWDTVKENLPNLNLVPLVDAENYSNVTVVCKKAAEMLAPKIMEKESVLLKLISTVSDKNYTETAALLSALKDLSLWDGIKDKPQGTVDFKKADEDAKATYPFLDWSDLEYENYVDDDKMSAIAKYVNAMDLFIDLTKDTAPKTAAPETVEKVEVAA